MVLAMLVLHANQVVTVPRLIDELWEEDPPPTARSTVQYFVHKLRDALDPQRMGWPLVTEADGYLLQVAPNGCDAIRFEALIRSARDARARGELAVAAGWLAEAFSLWRGPALADFASAGFAQPEIARLEELHLSAIEDDIEVQLGLGRHAELIGELSRLVRTHPLRERLHGLWMLALYRSGRQAEALEAYRATRRRLSNELGLEPGAELRRLEQAILAQDPKLDPPGSPTETPAAPLWPASDVPPGEAAGPDAGTAGVARTHAGPGSGVTIPAARRLVSVLVAGMAVVDRDPEVLLRRHEQLATQVGRTVARFGGMVQPASSAASLGCDVVAIFGSQRIREDDPERAVRAALELCKPDQEHRQVRVGVDTGMALTAPTAAGVGAITSSALSTAMGLQAIAPPGGVLVGTATFRATHRTITYAPEQTGEGRRALAPRSSTGAIAGASDSPSAMVDRDRELELLRHFLDRVSNGGEPQLVTVIGAPGIGKSRLIGEFGRLVEAAPDLIVWRQGRCHPNERDDSAVYGALAKITAAQAGITESDAATTAAHKIQQAVGAVIASPESAAEVSLALCALVENQTALQPVTAAGDWQGSRPPLIEAWVRFIDAIAADRPTVLVIEDLHEASLESLEVIENLDDRVGPVPLLVVVTARPELLAVQPAWGGGRRNAITIALERLTEPGSALLLDRLLAGQGRTLEPPDRNRVLAKAAGNPLFLEEYVRLIADHAAPAGAQAQMPIPERIEQLISARLDALPSGDKALLGDLAVLGDLSSVAAVAAIGDPGSDRDEVEIEEKLARLTHQELLFRTRTPAASGAWKYAFRHPLIREIAYQQLLRADRAARHQRAASWLQTLPGDRADRVELIAHHYQQAIALTYPDGLAPDERAVGLATRARAALRAAGLHAMGLGALGVAARRLRQAMAIWPADDPDRTEVLVELGRVLAYGAHTGQDVLAEARDAATAADRHDHAAVAEALLSHLARVRAHPDQATEHILSALARPVTATAAEVEALASQAIDLLIADRHADAIRVASQVVDLATSLGLTAQVANGSSIRAHARLLAGDHLAIREAEQAITELEAHQHPVAVFAHFGYCHALYWYGDLRRCADALPAGRTVAETADAAIQLWFDTLEAGLTCHAGLWPEAEELAGRLLAEEPEGRAAYLAPWSRVIRARIHLGRGSLDAALTDARAALAGAQAAGDTRYRQVALAILGRALLAAGHRHQAIEAAGQVLADLAAAPERGCATTDLGLLLIDLDHPAGTLPGGLPSTRWHAAARALADQDVAGAVDRLAATGAHLDEAAARLRLAKQLVASGQPAAAAEHADQAAIVFRKAGATADLHHAEALLTADLASPTGAIEPKPAGSPPGLTKPPTHRHADRPAEAAKERQ